MGLGIYRSGRPLRPCPAGVRQLKFFISDAKLRHPAGALSVSVHFCQIWPYLTISVHLRGYTSMPYCSQTNLTATGGSSLSLGLTPSRASSSLWRAIHLCSVFRDTPAAAASSLLVIDFIIAYCLVSVDYQTGVSVRESPFLRAQVSAPGPVGACAGRGKRLRGPWQAACRWAVRRKYDTMTAIYNEIRIRGN